MFCVYFSDLDYESIFSVRIGKPILGEEDVFRHADQQGPLSA